jgi:thiosulfate dehydrogenase [quinone] large subunit
MATTGTPQSPRTWRERATTTGWALLPLRLFLGVTMVYAGLDKFFSPTYLDPSSPQGVYRQMISVAKSSPISWVVTQAAEQATLVGLLIAFGELLVGLGSADS